MKIVEMSLRPYFAALEAAATEINPFLVVVAIGLGVLNLALFMCQRHYATHTTAAGQVAYTPPLLQVVVDRGGQVEAASVPSRAGARTTGDAQP